MQRFGRNAVPENGEQQATLRPGEASILGNDDIHRVLVEWNRTEQAYDHSETVWGLIEKRARSHPGKTAVVDAESEIDYGHLTARAGAIAGELVARGVEPGSLVGVCMSRTWELVAALIGVLRAGCAYVPLDPGYPRKQVRYMLEHARAVGAIVDGEHGAALCDGVRELVRLDEVGDWTPGRVAGPSAKDLAYVLFTSGSTGRPKGVAVEHRSVVAMTQAMRGLLDDDELSGVLAVASISFDPSVMEILGTLALGGTVVLAENMLAARELKGVGRARTVIGVPSAIQGLLAAGGLPEGIRCVVLGGEVLKRSLVDQLHSLEQRPRVATVYGPTEGTVFFTATDVPAAVEITIGRPVANSRVYVLNDSMQPVPVGVSGELYLAGDQVARGYIHDEESTRQRFVELEPNGPIPEERLYRTGDLCRWREDGQLEFLGRHDDQVKVRGHRIELGEIESMMESMEGVDAAAAAVVDAMLVGYVAGPVASKEVRAYVAERLPKFMVPQVVVHLEELPYLPNGKLDRKRLPKPDVRRDLDGSAGLAGTSGDTKDERHAALLSVVRREAARILGVRDPGHVPAQCSFESLGLDSLGVAELSYRLETALNRKVPASALNEHPTPSAIADHLLDTMDGGTTGHAPKASVRGEARDTLGRLQRQIQSGHPPFLAAKASSWSASDKATLVRELKHLLTRLGRDPYGKFVRTGSAHKGMVTDMHTREERESVVWTTNLYLGLNRDETVVEEAISAVERFGTGMGTSATASGITDLHLQFEEAFADLVGKPAACLFPTGFTANLGAIAGILGENDVIVMDQLCHASVVDGARLSGATARTFQHNNPVDLESVLEAVASPYRTTLVVLEGVYSMGEGTAPVRDIVHVAKRYGALVLVDESHSFGFYGRRGAGLCAAQGVTDQVDFIMATLSKALGSLGGVVAAREEHIALLKSSARAYIFQATSTPADIAAALAALRRVSADDSLRERLWDTTTYMRQCFSEAGYDLGTGDGPIVTPLISDSATLYATARGLSARGIHTSAVTYPIVERGQGRLRFICSASHTRDDVDRTLKALIDAHREAEEGRQSIPAADGGRSQAVRSGGGTDVGVAKWAGAFSDYLQQTLASAPGRTPDLAVSIRFPSSGARTSILIRDGAVTVGDRRGADTAFCSLTFIEASSPQCLYDIKRLLTGIIEGTCVVSGQVEPFVWLSARMADWQKIRAESSAVAK